ncbi:MAG: AbrB/MazE/SpoVT family DNA-binding domain-containing protein [Deltaproteobacteria bacterium]|nr:AbrB/MazE/SpoVT family DNA-binding domain-containing protein [Deltaproteobacteria bacterium]
MLAKKTSKNQITLPRDAVKEFPGVDYFDVSVADGRICLIPVKFESAAGTIEKVRKKIAALGITEEDIRNAISWARGKRR